jgi:hypothetical protein
MTRFSWSSDFADRASALRRAAGRRAVPSAGDRRRARTGPGRARSATGPARSASRPASPAPAPSRPPCRRRRLRRWHRAGNGSACRSGCLAHAAACRARRPRFRPPRRRRPHRCLRGRAAAFDLLPPASPDSLVPSDASDSAAPAVPASPVWSVTGSGVACSGAPSASADSCWAPVSPLVSPILSPPRVDVRGPIPANVRGCGNVGSLARCWIAPGSRDLRSLQPTLGNCAAR